ncbi:hypothetical protein [Thalassotalea profundi]|uniref:hypothetical protein n=1 Tax=Thalassotalea profundi TaxID=2036687 RepID=UPI00167C25A5|nr:hypothetical protein [Thalassotalea profundi]
MTDKIILLAVGTYHYASERATRHLPDKYRVFISAFQIVKEFNLRRIRLNCGLKNQT